MASRRWRCGRARHHLEEHGDWVSQDKYSREKWRCGAFADAPMPHRRGPLYYCPWSGCEYRSPQKASARHHWYSHITPRNKTFNSTHGTEAGYQYHKKVLKEDACDECAEAHRIHAREWMRQWRRGAFNHPGPEKSEWKGR